MRNFYSFLLILIVLCPFSTIGQNLYEFLQAQPEITEIKEFTGNEAFKSSYEISIKQALNHKDTTEGFFLQRIYISDISKDSPTVVITEGYSAHYASKPKYINELSSILNANQICIEHRYFGKSMPEPLDWKYLTVENAITDHHQIIQLLKKYYTGKWISTGISKGGQTAISHRDLYPHDVDVTVAYVGPINFGVEDGRHEPFIKKIPGTKKDRKKVFQFQKEVLKRKDELLPKLKDYSEKNNLTYKIPLKEVYDFSVLEYSFAFWQWGTSPEDIPNIKAPADTIFNHWMKVSSSDYFSNEGIKPVQAFFVQAAKELGYYGYSTKGLKRFLSIKTAKGYLNRIFLPEGTSFTFDPSTMKHNNHFLQTTNEKMIFIYGEYDPWTATAAIVPKNNELLKIVKPAGSHRTRINNLPEGMKIKVINTLTGWLK